MFARVYQGGGYVDLDQFEGPSDEEVLAARERQRAQRNAAGHAWGGGMQGSCDLRHRSPRKTKYGGLLC